MASKKSSSKAGSGSPSVGEPEYLVVGYLRRPHGVRGEMLMEIYTDFPERLTTNTSVYIGDVHQTRLISGLRSHGKRMLIKFQGVESPEDAGLLRNQQVCVRSADRPRLPAGQYYHHEIMGFSVVDENKSLIGELADIMRTGANEVYVVIRPDKTEVLLPDIPSVILNVDAKHRLIQVHLLPGLINEREK